MKNREWQHDYTDGKSVWQCTLTRNISVRLESSGNIGYPREGRYFQGPKSWLFYVSFGQGWCFVPGMGKTDLETDAAKDMAVQWVKQWLKSELKEVG